MVRIYRNFRFKNELKLSFLSLMNISTQVLASFGVSFFIVRMLPVSLTSRWYFYLSFMQIFFLMDIGFCHFFSKRLPELALNNSDDIAKVLFELNSALIKVLTLMVFVATIFFFLLYYSLVPFLFVLFYIGICFKILSNCGLSVLYGMGYLSEERIVRIISNLVFPLLSFFMVYFWPTESALGLSWIFGNILSLSIICLRILPKFIGSNRVKPSKSEFGLNRQYSFNYIISSVPPIFSLSVLSYSVGMQLSGKNLLLYGLMLQLGQGILAISSIPVYLFNREITVLNQLNKLDLLSGKIRKTLLLAVLISTSAVLTFIFGKQILEFFWKLEISLLLFSIFAVSIILDCINSNCYAIRVALGQSYFFIQNFLAFGLLSLLLVGIPFVCGLKYNLEHFYFSLIFSQGLVGLLFNLNNLKKYGFFQMSVKDF